MAEALFRRLDTMIIANDNRFAAIRIIKDFIKRRHGLDIELRDVSRERRLRMLECILN